MRHLPLVFVVTVFALFLAATIALAQSPITRIGPTFDGDSTSLTFNTPLGTETLDAGRNVGDTNTSDDPDCTDDLTAGLSAFGDLHSSCTPAESPF
jgi:hypothetical protein